MQNIITIIIAGFALTVGALSYWKSRKLRLELEKKEKEMNRKMYELAILKELGDRIGYFLNVQKIIDIITGSLGQFIDYSVVSYMLLAPEKIVFNVHLEQSVSKKFVDDIKNRMLESLSALLNKEFAKEQVEETISGAILIEDIKEPVRSFFNIPLVIGEKVVGVLTVAHTLPGLYKEEEMTILYKITKQASDAVTRLQEVVQTEQRKLNAMVESMEEGVVMTDQDYRIVVVNPAAKKAIGLEDKKEVSIFDFIDKLGGKFDIRGKLEESLKLDKVFEARDILIGGRFFQIFVNPVKTATSMAKQEKLGGVVILHDITRQKEAEKMKEDFTSMIVHELRSPLDGIKKLIEMMREEKIKEKAKAYSGYLQMIYKASSQMLELVNDLLDAAKIEAGRFEVYKSPADITDVIDGRISFFKVSASDAKIKLKRQFDNNLPKEASFDLVKINQVINNLLSNALKFTKAGGTITISALLHKKGQDINEEAKIAGIKWFLIKEEKSLIETPDSLVVAVTDNGSGIADKNIPQLFSKYKQLKNNAAPKDKKGTGLGLAVAKGIIQAHNGIIGVSSEEGNGSTFYFAIPLETTPEV